MKYNVWHDVDEVSRADVVTVEAASENDAIAKVEQDSSPNNDFRLNGEVYGLGRLHEYLAVEES